MELYLCVDYGQSTIGAYELHYYKMGITQVLIRQFFVLEVLFQKHFLLLLLAF